MFEKYLKFNSTVLFSLTIQGYFFVVDILGNAYLSSFFLAGQNSADLKQSMIAYTRAVCVFNQFMCD